MPWRRATEANPVVALITGITGRTGSYLAKLRLKDMWPLVVTEVYFCWVTRNYREVYGLLAVNSIWFVTNPASRRDIHDSCLHHIAVGNGR